MYYLSLVLDTLQLQSSPPATFTMTQSVLLLLLIQGALKCYVTVILPYLKFKRIQFFSFYFLYKFLCHINFYIVENGHKR